MTLVLHIGFYGPFSGSWVTGGRQLQVRDEQDAQRTTERYTAYFKVTYGNNAEVTRLGRKD